MRNLWYLVLLFPVLALASDEFEAIKQCSHIEDDDKLIECFRAVMSSKTLEDGINPNRSAWKIRRDTDPLTDATRLVARLDIPDGIHRRSLIVRCNSSAPMDVYVIWDDYIADDRPWVTHRFDSEEARRSRWRVSNDNTATFAVSAWKFTKRLLESNRLVIRTVPYNESPVVLTFDTFGLEEALGENINICR